MIFLQGFSEFHLMPGEAVDILQKAEHQLGWEISHEEIELGWLPELLTAEDYIAPSVVFKIFFLLTFLFNLNIRSPHQTTYFYDSAHSSKMIQHNFSNLNTAIQSTN